MRIGHGLPHHNRHMLRFAGKTRRTADGCQRGKPPSTPRHQQGARLHVYHRAQAEGSGLQSEPRAGHPKMALLQEPFRLERFGVIAELRLC
jgi:hypothetical protein